MQVLHGPSRHERLLRVVQDVCLRVHPDLVVGHIHACADTAQLHRRRCHETRLPAPVCELPSTDFNVRYHRVLCFAQAWLLSALMRSVCVRHRIHEIIYATHGLLMDCTLSDDRDTCACSSETFLRLASWKLQLTAPCL